MQKLFDYPQRFAEQIFDRVQQALQRAAGEIDTTAQTGHLFILSADEALDPRAASIPELPARYVESSDVALVTARRAERCDETQLLSDRQEARCLLSYKTPGGWVAIRKTLLTEVLAEGRDVKITGLPSAAAGVLALMCRELVSFPDRTAVPSELGSFGS